MTRRLPTLACLLLLLSPPALAAKGPKISDDEIARTESAIRAAENAGATQHAREFLDRSRSALTAAQNERAKGHYDRARGWLDEARAAASAAESRARAVRIDEQGVSMRKELDDLERRAREFDAQAKRRNP